MTLRTQINDALKDALRNKDERGVGTIRLMIAEMKKRDIDARPSGNLEGIGEAEILSMLQTMIKQRRESIELYQKGNRPELAQQENEEIAVIERFMPKKMSDDEVKAAVTKAISDIGASGIKDMGKVMAELKKHYAGQMDFSQVGTLVKSQLAA